MLKHSPANMWIKVAKSCLRQKSVTWHTFEVELVLSLKQKVGRFCRWKFQVFLSLFYFFGRSLVCSELVRKRRACFTVCYIRQLRKSYDRCCREVTNHQRASYCERGIQYKNRARNSSYEDKDINAFFEIDG